MLGLESGWRDGHVAMLHAALARRAARGPADVLIDVTCPLVRTHPVAGTRSLFLDLDLDRAKHIEGMPAVAAGPGRITSLP